MEAGRIEEYLEYLKGRGYREGSIRRICRQVRSYVKMFPDEKDWNSASIPIFLKRRRRMFKKRVGRELKDSYLHALLGEIKRFLRYARGGEPSKGAQDSPLSWWHGQMMNYFHFCVCHQGLGEATMWRRRYFLTRFCQWLERHDVAVPDQMRSSEIFGFIQHEAHGYSRSSIKALNAAMRGFFRYLYHKGILTRDLSSLIISPRTYREERIPSYLTDSQVASLLNTIDTTNPRGFRDYTILVLLIQYGLRVKEIGDLEVNNISWSERTVLIKDRKAQPHLLLPLTDTVAHLLTRYIHFFRPISCHPKLFLALRAPERALSTVSITNMVKKRFHDAGIEGHAHLIRHTFAKKLIEQGESLPVIQKLLGHQSIASTRIYARLNIKQLREVVDGDFMEE